MVTSCYMSGSVIRQGDCFRKGGASRNGRTIGGEDEDDQGVQRACRIRLGEGVTELCLLPDHRATRGKEVANMMDDAVMDGCISGITNDQTRAVILQLADVEMTE